jgi:hypothetical protein
MAAAELSAKVAVLKKASTIGGTGNMGMGPFAVERQLQRLKQVPLTREDAFTAVPSILSMAIPRNSTKNTALI